MKQEKSKNTKDLLTLIQESEKKRETLQELSGLLETWQSLSIEEQIKRRSSLLTDLSLLESRDRKLCINKLSEAGIISRQDVNKVIEDTRQALNISDETDDKSLPHIYTVYFPGLVDIVEDNGGSAFLIKEKDSLKITKRIEKDDVIYLPPPKEYIPWLLPTGERILDYYGLDKALDNKTADSFLYDELVSYHKAISEFPSLEYYDLIAAWILHTYLLESIKYSPIICLFAIPERGKTRTGQGMIYLAYHGIHVESLRDAYLVRVANDLKASLFFDVMNIWHKAEKNGTEDILLHRFERGAKVPRVLYPEKGPLRDTVYYSVFGPTIISTNEGLHRILDTRAISINMPQSVRSFENDVTPESSIALKEKLVSFRARHLEEPLPNIPKPARGRLGDILKSLHQIILLAKPEKCSSFLKLVKIIEEERLIEKTGSLEAEILKEVVMLQEKVNRSTLPVKEITDALNTGKADKYQLSYQRVGRSLSAMGFKKIKTVEGSSGIIFDEDAIERLKASYGLHIKETPVIPVTPVMPGSG